MPQDIAPEWRPIPDFPYEVSNQGRVRRTEAGTNTWQGRVLKGSPDRYGYIVVALCHRGKVRRWRVHRLVCIAFHGTSDLPEVRHLDGDPSNNNVSNLAWGTPLQNAADRIRHGRSGRGKPQPSRKRHLQATLTEDQARQLRAVCAAVRMEHTHVSDQWIAQTARQYELPVHEVRKVLFAGNRTAPNGSHSTRGASSGSPVWTNAWLNRAGWASA